MYNIIIELFNKIDEKFNFYFNKGAISNLIEKQLNLSV